MSNVPPLTKAQASELYDISGLPVYYDKYKDRFVEEMVILSTSLKKRLPFEELKKQVSDICSRELLKGEKFFRDAGYNSFDEMLEAVLNSKAGKQGYEDLLKGKIDAIIPMLVEGFKDVAKEHFIFDKDGNIIDLQPGHKNRQRLCDAYLKEIEREKTRTERGEQKMASFKESSKEFAKTYAPSRGKINLGEVNAAPLTLQQANQLLDAGKFPSKLNKYRNQLAQEIVNQSKSLPSNQRRKFETLLELLKHTCAIEMLTGIYDAMDPAIQHILSEPDDELSKEEKLMCEKHKDQWKVDAANADQLFNQDGDENADEND